MPCGLRLGLYVGYFLFQKCPKNSVDFPNPSHQSVAGGSWIVDRILLDSSTVGSVAAGSFLFGASPHRIHLWTTIAYLNDLLYTWVFSVKFLHFGPEKMKCRVSTQTTCPSQKVGLLPLFVMELSLTFTNFRDPTEIRGVRPSRSTSLGPELLKDTSFGSENSWSSYMKDIGASDGGTFRKENNRKQLGRGDLVECYLDGNLFLDVFGSWFFVCLL